MRRFRISGFLAAGLPLLLVATLLTVAVWPVTMAWLGIPLAQGRWFADLYSLLATSDAFALGLDPYRPNPLDPLHAPHWYTDWWFWLHDIGLTRSDASWLGLAGNLLFLAATVVLLRPAGGGEILVGWLLVASPAVLLGLNRANPDLVIVALFALAAGLLFFLSFHATTYYLLRIHFLPLVVCLTAFMPMERIPAWWARRRRRVLATTR